MSTADQNNDDFGLDFEIEGVDDVQIDIEDDTPEADKGREPLPKELVEELENDELEEYSEKVKIKLKQMKKVWHDERREKERLQREQDQAIATARRLLDENRTLKKTLSQGEMSLLDSYKQSALLEKEQARKAYREAYEAGDTDRVLEANEKLQAAQLKLSQLDTYKPTLQDVEDTIDVADAAPVAPQIDRKTRAWQERNQWYGSDPEMTAAALGLHQKLETERGPQFVGSDEYWTAIDATMSRRFPEYFGESEKQPSTSSRSSKPNVVAPASRSTSPKKIVLKQSQVDLAKKLGITPEQYAKELAKTER
jgi:hypothetical protein